MFPLCTVPAPPLLYPAPTTPTTTLATWLVNQLIDWPVRTSARHLKTGKHQSISRPVGQSARSATKRMRPAMMKSASFQLTRVADLRTPTHDPPPKRILKTGTQASVSESAEIAVQRSGKLTQTEDLRILEIRVSLLPFNMTSRKFQVKNFFSFQFRAYVLF